MSKTPSSEKQSVDVFKIVNDTIISCLEKGIVPWKVPWVEQGIPQNFNTSKPYRNVNIMLLTALGYDKNLFITSKQLEQIGGTITQGSKGHMLSYWNYDKSKNQNGDHIQWEGPELRYYTVFNVAQCNIPEFTLPNVQIPPDATAVCEHILEEMPNKPAIEHKKKIKGYDPLTDSINIAIRTAFQNDEEYYAALFHSIIHATGHHSRLNRKDMIQMSEYGWDAFSHEELVAEIGTAYLLNNAGIIKAIEATDEYLKGWIAKFKTEKYLVLSAASQAQKAIDYILNVKFQEEKLEE
jgi:antirestriction protein ArdC